MLAPGTFALLAAAVPIGLVFGVLPGLSGITALAVLMPFVYGVEPLPALCFLLAAHAVVNTSSAMTAIVIGIPGAPASAATVFDGYPLARQGRAGYAMGAAFVASGIGGLFGFVVLLVLLPLLQDLALAFGSPETLALAVMGLTFIAALGQGAMVKGLIASVLGIILALVGYQPISGVPRFWLGSEYLLDGIRLVPAVTGLFAIPEILELASGGTIARGRAGLALGWREVWAGAWAVIHHRWVLLSSSVIGVVIGVVPGIGGNTAPFVAYAAARQTARAPERFGRGEIEGVIAPEASNNSKEGGDLVPTLALGIPGGAGMAVLLGAFQLVGLQPGPRFLSTHGDIAIGLALTLAVANVAGALLMILLIRPFARLTLVPGRILAPILLVMTVLGVQVAGNNVNDLVVLLAFGALGIAMKRFDYSRPALLVGFILGPLIETYLHISYQAYGLAFLGRPIVLGVAVLTAAGLVAPLMFRRSRR